MQATRPAALSGIASDTAQLAKAALRRLALDKLEPTPENYARAWRQESGEPPEAANDGPAIAALIERIVRGLERGSRGWSAGRKKESLQRVLDGSRSDVRRLQQRLAQLVASWDGDAAEGEPTVSGEADIVPSAAGDALPVLPRPLPPPSGGAASETEDAAATPDAEAGARWGRAVGALGDTVAAALPLERNEAAHRLAAGIETLVRQIVAEGASGPRVDALVARCSEATPVLRHRQLLFEQLNLLCIDLAASLTDLAEDESWARGQCEAMRVKLDEGLSVRGIRAVGELLRDTRERQGALRAERERARQSLKGLIARMLAELGELGSRTGQFHHSVGRYADVIERADSLESLTGAVREMVEESRAVEALVQQTQARLSAEHGKAQGLSRRVVELEGEMQRLSNEVLTDQLTQVANRRGFERSFEAEQQRIVDGSAAALAVGLLDIDNFKRLNDELGHLAGDEALKALAALVARTLRPGDHVARYGGEEFVVLLPDTGLEEGTAIMNRLQRSLTGGLFLHEEKRVFVTFSAGLTAYRSPERIEDALERADQALYEAKRSGKNRTCIAQSVEPLNPWRPTSR